MDLILQKSGSGKTGGKTGQPEVRTFSASHFWSVMGPSGLFSLCLPEAEGVAF
jgi:hypothetical protein